MILKSANQSWWCLELLAWRRRCDYLLVLLCWIVWKKIYIYDDKKSLSYDHSFFAFTNKFSHQLFTTGVREHQSNRTCFRPCKVSSDVHTGYYILGRFIHVLSCIYLSQKFFRRSGILTRKPSRQTNKKPILKGWSVSLVKMAFAYFCLVR